MDESALSELWRRFEAGDRLALARLLTLAATGQATEWARRRLSEDREVPKASPSAARVVAITGPGGVGKSSLVGRLIGVVRGRGHRVAVLACDPQSSLTGGALLGDRIRMTNRSEDDGVFIRSLAVPHGSEAIAPHLEVMTQILLRFGFDTVILETAGAGQGDTAIRAVADVVVLLVQPQTGDELQWEKAGLLEVADIVAVHKADLPGAEHVESDLRAMLNLPGSRTIPVLRTSASRDEGVAELWDAIEACPGSSWRLG